MSENGKIYTTGKNFTLPLAVTAWTNSTSANTHHPPPAIQNPQSIIHYPHHFEKTSSSLDWTGSVRRGGADQDIWPPCSLGEVLTKFKTQHLAENYHHTYHEFRGLGFAVVTVGLFLAFFYNVVVSE